MSLIELIEKERLIHSMQGYDVKEIIVSDIHQKDEQTTIDKYNCKVSYNPKYKDEKIIIVWKNKID